ncbi:MAG: hypothetical protein H6R10_2322 [Rhodocyclaceae bacterium]|nr:hypothetical protein [Rhodocyclaceae bacterium]
MESRKTEQSKLPWSAVPRRRASDWLIGRLRLPIIIASVISSLTYADMGHAAPTPGKKPFSSRQQGLRIQVEGGGWGQVPKAAIETVLYSVADELMARLPRKLATPIVVTHTESSPIALYERGPQGEYLIRLHASGEDWQFYVYEFAHELCHLLSNYEENVGADPTKYNQWFEETLCETASLFTLKNLATTWEAAPPGPEWVAQAGKLRRFFNLLINEAHRQLPPNSPLASWLRTNEEALKRDPYLRKKNEVVANLLLPLFEKHPENWDALTYLNLNPTDARSNFQQYLNHWYQNAPDEHKLFVSRILTVLLQDGKPPLAAPLIASGGAGAGVAGVPGKDEGGPRRAR